MTSKTENFLKFFTGIETEDGKVNSKKLISFASPNSHINFGNVVNNLSKQNRTFFYWEKPDEEFTILGIDTLYNVKNFGEKRTEKSRKEIEQWIDKFYSNFEDFNLKTVPLFMGGMKFSPEGESEHSIWNDFADSDWFIPKIVFLKKGNLFYVVFNLVYENYSADQANVILTEYEKLITTLQTDFLNGVRETVQESNLDDNQEKENWINKVNSALSHISDGSYKKIVLSRRVTLQLSHRPALYEKLECLAHDYPRCYIFAYGKNDSVFFGASPEKLAKIYDGWVEADALAGSTPRGKDKIEDDKLAEELLLSKKNLNEQYAVVDFITNSFSGFSDEIVYDKKPIVRKLSNIQHLWTPIKAKLKSGHTIFSILREIHPTPAICGVPWSGALDFIRATEGYNRGFYAGIIGWFNFEEQGEFAVSIRSALLKDTLLYAFAGCGIVEGSDPEQEFEEAELKLKPILSLFPHEKIYQS